MSETTTDDALKRGAGAPKNNRNALRHGLRAGKCGPKEKYLEVRSNTLRRYLEDACLKAHQEVGETHAALIRAIVDQETHRGRMLRILRTKADTLSISDQLKVSEAIGKASAIVADKVAKLNLDRDSTDDLYDKLYGNGKPSLVLLSPPTEKDVSDGPA